MDRRELILARLLAVLTATEGVIKAVRNDLQAPEGKLPMVILLDGDEQSTQSDEGRGRPSIGPRIMNLMPEIYLIVQDGENAGPDLNSMRRRIIYNILHDEPLLALVKDREIRFEGVQTAMALGRAIAGEMGLDFTFPYVLRDAELAPDEGSTEDATETPTGG